MPSVSSERRRTGRLSDRVREQHAAVHALMDDGFGLRAIGRRPGLARDTVRRPVGTQDPDELLVGRWTGRTSILDPYKPYIHQRFAEGHSIARRLFEEIRQRGFPGQEQIVAVYVRRLRETFPRQDPPRRKPSVRDVTSWITRHSDRLRDEDARQLKEVLARVPVLATAAEHLRTFAEPMNDRRGRELKNWITRVQQDQVRPFEASPPVSSRTSMRSSPV
ncbi:hypothetical protein ACFV0O_32545 [Kitasatospora sp. NPDC059577]|uniref:hypothetical protein n=1 Tax=Kitasatospora sp. NPDC059577 TaxID=3346873 RepID=UPI0036941459